MKASHELQEDIVLAKTIWAENLNFAPFSLEFFKYLYLNSLHEIVAEYQENNAFPEIPYVFSSPSFRVLLSSTCQFNSTTRNGQTKLLNPEGVYFGGKNAICLNIWDIFTKYDFNIRFKATLRHEFHHASKAILHAPYPKQPEVDLPCEFHTNVSYEITQTLTGWEKIFIDIYSDYFQIVNRGELANPIYPFYDNPNHLDYFKRTMEADLSTVMNRVQTDNELTQLIQSQYKPLKIREQINFSKNYTKEFFNALHKDIVQGKTPCFNFQFSDSVEVPLCITELENFTPNDITRVHVNGYSAEDPFGKGVLQAFFYDLSWYINIVNFYYDCKNCDYKEWDAFIFGNMPYPIFRRVFTGLENIRIQEYMAFKDRADILNICPVSLNSNRTSNIDSSKLSECLTKICRDDFILDEFLQEKINYYREYLYEHINCDYHDLDCFKQYIKSTVTINLDDAEFLASMNITKLNQYFIERGWCLDKCNTLKDLQINLQIQLLLLNLLKLFMLMSSEIYSLLPPWYYVLGAVLLAFKNEILYLIQIRQNLQAPSMKNFNPETILATFQRKAGMSLSGMYLRMVLPLDVCCFYDITNYTKNSIKKDILNSIANNKLPRNCCGKINLLVKSFAKGLCYSIGNLGWQYCAGPFLGGLANVFQGIKQGFRENGIYGSVVECSEIMGAQIIPGGEALLTAQSELLYLSDKISSESGLNVEPCNPEPVMLHCFKKRSISVVPGSAIYGSIIHDDRINFASARSVFSKPTASRPTV